MRCTRSAGLPVPVLALAAVVAVVAVAVASCLVGRPFADAAGGAPPAGSPGGSGAAVTLTYQTPTVSPSSPGAPATLDLGLLVDASAGTASQLEVSLALYDRLDGRSQLEADIATPPGAGLLSRSVPIGLDCLGSDAHGGRALPVAVTTSVVAAGETPCADGGATSPTLPLDCTPGTCSGVYPLVISVERRSDQTVMGRLTTFLTYTEAASAEPLRVALVLGYSLPTRVVHGTTDPAALLATPSAAAAAPLGQLVGALRSEPAVPVTVAADPETLQAVARSGDAGARSAQAALLATSATPATRQFLAEPYVPVDLTALTAAGLTGEVTLQMRRGEAVAAALGQHASAGPLTWVSGANVGSALAAGLPLAGATRLVVPDGTLAGGGTGATGDEPFGLSLTRSQSVDAAASDTLLADHFTSDPGDPVLAANQLLADIAFLHFEAPFLDRPVGVVAVAPADWVPSSAFLDTVLAGLDANPVATPVTLNGLFSSVPAAGAVRHLGTAGAGTPLAAPAAGAIAAARLRFAAFTSAVVGSPPVLGQLGDVILAAQSSRWRTAGSLSTSAAFTRSLDAQLALLSLATDRTITLTSRSGSIPVTVIRSTPYAMVGSLALAGDKFTFPEGSTVAEFPLDRSTNPVRVYVSARTTGDLPLDVTLTSPEGGLILAKGELTVRSTATSLAGIVLTALAAAVLLAWWGFTWWRSRTAATRHGRHAP